MRLRSNKPIIGRKTPQPFRWIVMIVTALIGFAIYWSHITVLPEIVRASGQVAPLGELRNIGHFDGGVVENVLVRPGDTVEIGDVIAIVRQPHISDNLARTAQQIDALAQDAERLEVLLKFLKDGAVLKTPEPSQEVSIADRYQNEQMELFLSRKSTLEARVNRAMASFETTEQVAQKMQERIDLVRERKARAQARFDKGLTTIADLDRETDRLDQIIAEAMQADLRTLDARDRYHESLAAVENERLAIQQDFTSELYDTETELARLRTDMALYRASEQRADVLATVNGTIQTVYYSSMGEIVPAGATIVSVLPTNDQLVAKVRVNPVDIGHIGPSTPARIALTTFDVRRYGHLEGTILSISPTSTLNEREEPHYEITVALAETEVAHEGIAKNIRAGMEVSTEFRTQSRTLLEYFVGPVQSSLTSAFTESQ